MRKAYHNVKFVTDEKEEIIGISLGCDFCAEHEWGIKKMRRAFGMPDELKKSNFGLKFRTITVFDEKRFSFFRTEKKSGKMTYNFAVLIFDCYWDGYVPERMPHDLQNYQDNMIPGKWHKEPTEIMTAWDEEGFGIVVMGEKPIKYLEEVYEAFKKKDVCIGLFGGGAFENSHLTISIKSKMPAEIDGNLKKGDLESFETSKIREKWEKKAQKAGKKSFEDFMCISPRFFAFGDNEKEKEMMKKYNTKYNFHIWINGSNDNYGWYTGEQVEAWFKSNKQIKEFRNESK